MKVPYSWLAEWTELPWEARELGARLTMSGFELESLEAAAPPFTGVVVAEILAAERHPQAEKLQVCRVSTGSGAPLQIVCGAGVRLLLDLHNLYANAVNFGDDPHSLLCRLPLECVTAVHLSGGRRIDGPDGARRLLDDHLHDIPADVFALLSELGRLAPQPLTIVIERDGRFPPVARLLDQLDSARAALAAGREAAA